MKDKEIEEILIDLLKNVFDDNKHDLQKLINEALKEEATISIKKFKDGTAKTNIKGRRLSVLITLAGLEKTILEDLKPPKGLWEKIKNVIGVKEANDNE